MLAVPGTFSPLSRLLLAYDGSPKSKEALYIATYMAARGHLPLTVVTILEGGQVTPDTLTEARQYLQRHGVRASLVRESGPVAEAILRAVEESESDLILMGGYGHNPLLEVVLGSAVDRVLRASQQPVLICR